MVMDLGEWMIGGLEDILVQYDLPSLREEVGLAVHRVAVCCSAMEDEYWNVRFSTWLSHGCVPQVYARRKVEIAAPANVGVKRPKGWVPVPTWSGGIVAG